MRLVEGNSGAVFQHTASTTIISLRFKAVKNKLLTIELLKTGNISGKAVSIPVFSVNPD
jgi:hypothetical protein